jgi:hypothetical protein
MFALLQNTVSSVYAAGLSHRQWRWLWRGILGGLCLLAVHHSFGQVLSAADESQPQATAAKILSLRCVGCHNSTDKQGNLDLTQRESTIMGGDSGPAIEPGIASHSLIWQRITAEEMPPQAPLNQEERGILAAWIAAGAAWPKQPLNPFDYTSTDRAGYDWWSLQPLQTVELHYEPGVAPHPIDLYIDTKLSAVGLQRGSPATRSTLVRRLYFDLHGIPPTSAQREKFLTDHRPDSVARLIDELLSAPEYGQRWARHWLDLARFGESQGFERDKLRTNSWRYRDWVVNALNRDLPYDEFARLQLAGDVLQPGNADGLIATGFLVAAPYDEVGQKQQSAAMRAVVRQDELEDLVGTVTQTFLGLTANCARCHDHKFDPISQREYYQLAAALAGVHHGEPKLAQTAVEQAAQPWAPIYASRIDALKQQLEAIEAPNPPAALDERLSEQLRFELDQLLEHQRRLSEPATYAVAASSPQATHVLLRGNPATPGEQVAAGGIAALRSLSADFSLDREASDAERRQQLAQWITDVQNPLFARVMANRVWQYHFGTGLVDTPSDFGFSGGRPSHPELLDWLANELIRSGWSLKHLHRCILNSATYQQTSQLRAEGAAKDRDNRLMWRWSPRRLDAETLRDSLHQFAGKLDRSLGGPGFYEFTTHVHNSQFYEPHDTVGPTFQRRALYRTWVRSARSHFLDAYDCPDPSIKTPQRAVTTTPSQALALLNNSFVLRMSDALAERASQAAPHGLEQQVQFIFDEVLARPAAEDELEACCGFAQQAGLAAFCRVLFNCNELLYVD